MFHNHLPLEKDMALYNFWEPWIPFIWINLNLLHQRMLCAKFGWNNLKSVVASKFIYEWSINEVNIYFIILHRAIKFNLKMIQSKISITSLLHRSSKFMFIHLWCINIIVYKKVYPCTTAFEGVLSGNHISQHPMSLSSKILWPVQILFILIHCG